MTGIIVFARCELNTKVKWVETGGLGVGVWGMGNKGAVGVRLGVRRGGGEGTETVLTFVAAHLAPMEEKWERRNEDWKNICEGLVFEMMSGEPRSESKQSETEESEPLLASDQSQGGSASRGMFSPASNLFFAGDLNYRTSDTAPEPSEHHTWPQPTDSTSEADHYSHFLPRDQLTRELAANKTLHNLAEAPIDFPPTYKYSTAAQKHALDSLSLQTRTLADGRVVHTTELAPRGEEEVWLWAKHRVPSWCDRVLFLKAAKPKVHAYAALPVQPTSDHRPVALYCTLPAKGLEGAEVHSPFQIRNDWRERRAAAKRYELIVGFWAYLALTWEGEALLLGSVVGIIGGYLVLKALLGT